MRERKREREIARIKYIKIQYIILNTSELNIIQNQIYLKKNFKFQKVSHFIIQIKCSPIRIYENI